MLKQPCHHNFWHQCGNQIIESCLQSLSQRLSQSFYIPPSTTLQFAMNVFLYTLFVSQTHSKDYSLLHITIQTFWHSQSLARLLLFRKKCTNLSQLIHSATSQAVQLWIKNYLLMTVHSHHRRGQILASTKGIHTMFCLQLRASTEQRFIPSSISAGPVIFDCVV